VNPLKVILATLFIFASGVVTGGLLVFNIQPKPSVTSESQAQIPMPWFFQRMDFFRRIRRELDLSAEQDTKIQQIINEGQDRLRPLWQEVGPRMQDELRLVRRQIAAELTPDQQKRFDQLIRPKNYRRFDESPAQEDHRQRRFLLPDGSTKPVPGASRLRGTNGFPATNSAAEHF
jgi:hypothetical protein